MKATGIVRRIDDLGRIVIPKEIRKTLKVKEGMPLEIYTDKEGGIILRKFLPFSERSFKRRRNDHRAYQWKYGNRPCIDCSSQRIPYHSYYAGIHEC